MARLFAKIVQANLWSWMGHHYAICKKKRQDIVPDFDRGLDFDVVAQRGGENRMSIVSSSLLILGFTH